MKKPLRTTARTFQLTLRSIPQQVRRVEGFLQKVGEFAHLDEIQMHKLMVSVTEAANNAIIHGNKLDAGKKVKLTCEVSPRWLVVTVSDQGRGFDLKKIRNPLEEKNLMRESGRGIFLMRTLMDKVEYVAEGGGVQVELWMDLKNSRS